MDGLTPLHFATYCGASPDVIELLLRYENDALLKYYHKKNESLDRLGYHNERKINSSIEVSLNQSNGIDGTTMGGILG